MGHHTTWEQVSLGNNHSAAIDYEGDFWTWGRNTSGELGLGNYTQQN